MDESRVRSWVRGGAPRGPGGSEIASHVAICPSCAALVDRLSRSAASHPTLAGGVQPSEPPLHEIQDDRPLPERIGEYRLIRKLGQGGMGVVYEAEQDTPRRRVALKLVRGNFADELRVKMFRHEMQALARLSHPGIAAIYDAGVSDENWPFFSMELVQGEELGRFLTGEMGRRMPLRERLSLFLDICDAVVHAHQRGVIHRDLKPSNILVTIEGREEQRTSGSEEEGAAESGASRAFAPLPLRPFAPVPKILDFGLARVTERDVYATSFISETGRLVGTLQYMSPEQARGDTNLIDVRTDVYALSLILFEMLTGARAYSLDPMRLPEALQTICETLPPNPRTLNRAIPADVATIVLRGLEKLPQRRYASVAELAEDVRRFLAFQPILARPPSIGYLFARFARRNRVAVAAAATVLLTILAGLIVTSAALTRALSAERQAGQRLVEAERARRGEREQREKAERERERAEQERETAAAVNNFLNDMLASVNPAVGDREMTVEQALDRASDGLGTAFEGRPIVEARVRDTLGRSYVALGKYEPADRHLTTALGLFERNAGPDDAGTLDTTNDLATLRQRQGNFAEAERLFRRASDGMARVAGSDSASALATLNNLGMLLATQGRYADAEPVLQKALDALRRTSGAEDIATLDAMSNLATVLQYAGRLKEAEPLARESLETRRRVFGNRHPGTLVAVNNLGTLLTTLDRNEEAEPLYVEGLELSREILGDDHPDTLTSLTNLAGLLHDLRRNDESVRMYRESIERLTHKLGENHPDTITAMRDLAGVLRDQRKLDESEALLRRAVERFHEAVGDDHPDAIAATYGLGMTLLARKAPNAAEPLLRDAMERFGRVVGEKTWKFGMFRASWGQSLADMGRLDDGERAMRTGAEIMIEAIGPGASVSQNAIRNLVTFYEKNNRDADAEQWRARLPAAPRGATSRESP